MSQIEDFRPRAYRAIGHDHTLAIVAGTFPNDKVITRLVMAMLIEWALRRRYLQLNGLYSRNDAARPQAVCRAALRDLCTLRLSGFLAYSTFGDMI